MAPAKKKPANGDKAQALTDKQKAFITEYLVDLNATQAAIRAGYSEKTARQIANTMLTKVYIQEAIALAMKEREQRTEISADRVLREWWNMLTADMNDLVEHRRGCCRFCYGEGHRFQRTPQEHKRDMQRQDDDGRVVGIPPEDDGGIGFDPRKAPNPDCPECFGDGYGRVIVKDTRQLPAEVRALYAGIKQTKEGIEVKLHSKDKAMEMLARHLGMFTEKVELTGKNGGAIETKVDMTLAPDQAYLKMLGKV